MELEFLQLLSGISLSAQASPPEVEEAQKRLGKTFPGDYVRFLSHANGGEGFVGKGDYVMFWPVQELASANEEYEVQEKAPGLLVFGSNGGGEAFGFDTRTPPWRVVIVPFIGMDWDAALPMGNSFQEFVQRLYRGDSPFAEHDLNR